MDEHLLGEPVNSNDKQVSPNPRTKMLEERLEDAGRNGRSIELSLIIDELGIEPEPRYQVYYDQGIEWRSNLSKVQIEGIKMRIGLIEAKPKKRQNLRAIAESYSKEDEARSAPAEPEKRLQPKQYTIAQYDIDKSMDGYVKVKRVNLRTYEEAIKFLEMFGTPTLKIEGGKQLPLKECTPSRVIAAAIGRYDDAQIRLKEKRDNLREIINGSHPEYE